MSDPVEGVRGERRRAERRRMPYDVKQLVDGLMAEARRPGAVTAGGVEWRTIRLGTLNQVVSIIRSCYLSDPEES